MSLSEEEQFEYDPYIGDVSPLPTYNAPGTDIPPEYDNYGNAFSDENVVPFHNSDKDIQNRLFESAAREHDETRRTERLLAITGIIIGILAWIAFKVLL